MMYVPGLPVGMQIVAYQERQAAARQALQAAGEAGRAAMDTQTQELAGPASVTKAQMRRVLQQAMRAHAALAKAVQAQDERIEALETRIAALESGASSITSFLGMGGQTSGIAKLIGMALPFINQSDVVQSPEAAALADVVSSYAEGHPQGAALAALATLLRAYAYYDADVGLSSIYTSDGSGSGSSSTATVAEVLAALTAAGEDETVATIEEIVAALEG